MISDEAQSGGECGESGSMESMSEFFCEDFQLRPTRTKRSQPLHVSKAVI